MSQNQSHAFVSVAAVSGQSLIPAPQATSKIVVIGMTITAEAADKVTLSFSAGNRKIFEFAVAGTVAFGAMRWEGDAGAALSVTTSTAGPADISIDYVPEAA